MKLRKLSGFVKPSEAMILAIIFAITLALFAFQILPGFDEINPYDETKYVDSGRNLLSGDLRELARGPLVAFLYAPLYLAFRDSPDWFIIIDGIGRLMLFSGLWISSIYVASRLKSYVHPLVIAGVLLCSSYPVWLLRNPSDALFSTFSALTLGKTFLDLQAYGSGEGPWGSITDARIGGSIAPGRGVSASILCDRCGLVGKGADWPNQEHHPGNSPIDRCASRICHRARY